MGEILDLVRSGEATTRAELAAVTGLARSTVSQRVDALLASRLVVTRGDSVSTGGRPPTKLAFNANAGVVLAADCGATHCRTAVVNLGGEILAENSDDIAIREGPDVVLAWVAKRFEELLEGAGRTRDDVRCVGIGLPGPVEFATGTPVNPPIMPGWDRFPVAAELAERFATPVLVDNDVNLMALGEHSLAWKNVPDLVMVKVGTGIGMGIIADGKVFRGAQGSAGDIGHTILPSYGDVQCACGNHGCLEAVAGGGAIARRLTAAGIPAANAREVVERVREGNAEAVRLVRQAGRELGGVLATVVNLINPSVVVMGGALAAADSQLLAGVREMIYQRSTPLATHALRIVRTAGGARSAVIGAGRIAIEHVLSPARVEPLGAPAAG